MSQGAGFYHNSSPYSQQQASPGGGGSGETKRHSVRPMTIAQVFKATQAHTDAEWTLNGHEVGQVRVIGHVVNVSQQATNTVYLVDDGTGKVEARRWREQSSEEDVEKWGNIEVNQVISVTGNMKAFGNKKYVNATSVRLSEDPNETTFHMVEALTITLSIENGSPNGSPAAQKLSGAASAYTVQSSGGANNDMAEYEHLPVIQREIIKAILSQPEADEGGVDVGVISKSVQAVPGVNPNAISDALDALMDAGHIYSTSDDSHFQVSR